MKENTFRSLVLFGILLICLIAGVYANDRIVACSNETTGRTILFHTDYSTCPRDFDRQLSPCALPFYEILNGDELC